MNVKTMTKAQEELYKYVFQTHDHEYLTGPADAAQCAICILLIDVGYLEDAYREEV